MVSGATGYIGGAVARVLRDHGHEVLGLARSERSATALRDRGVVPVAGDFGDPAGLSDAVRAADPDAVVSTASLGNDASTFAKDRDAVSALRDALGDDRRKLVFTSGSAVFGTFSGGEATETVHDERAVLPLPPEVFAPASAKVHPVLALGFGAAMKARVETERLVLTAAGVQGIVVRPGLVYGHGGSFDVPTLISLARAHGHGVHLGAGATIQGYVHIDDLAELYRLAVESAPAGTVLHGVAGEVTLRELAAAASRMIGAAGRTEGVGLARMLGMTGLSATGFGLTRRMPTGLARRLQAVFPPPAGAGAGLSVSLGKRLSAEATRRLLDWSPQRHDILEDVESGSYAGFGANGGQAEG
ncbi:NAD-dependent epimerase/dehydratase family protein [Pseudonocardia xishanensis]|uniref:NAD-dependent epimerase/dehydratase family protein n=1 Tax=Pseudonocardia xishanensis TaxID=630995 RepID=A0ABP8S275_9PSEU